MWQARRWSGAASGVGMLVALGMLIMRGMLVVKIVKYFQAIIALSTSVPTPNGTPLW